MFQDAQAFDVRHVRAQLEAQRQTMQERIESYSQLAAVRAVLQLQQAISAPDGGPRASAEGGADSGDFD